MSFARPDASSPAAPPAPQAQVIESATPVGAARSFVHRPEGVRPVGGLVLGHGAGGGVHAVDLTAVTRSALAAGWVVVLVEQPWRVAGRKVAGPPKQLDAAWTAVVTDLRSAGGPLATDVFGGPLVLGGRSAGARVACRTAGALGAKAVCCLAFPLHPPGRPDRSRAEELLACPVPVLVVQGRRDAFGTPQEVADVAGGVAVAAAGHRIEVRAVDGDHSLKVAPAVVGGLVAAWLREVLAGYAPSAEIT